MWERINQRLVKLNTVLGFIAVLLALTSVTPVLAEFLGPDRKKTETVSSCQVNLLQCQYVEAKDDWIYKVVNDWLCSNESKPWKSYPSSPSGDCSPSASGDKYWEKDESTKEVTKTYPAATITGTLENCTLNNGWCTTSPQLTLEGTEPVSGYKIIALEGTLNGQTFSCVGATCSVPLVQGDNVFTYWALSSWGDSSKKGLMTVSVDSQGPVLSGTLNGSPGSNGWYSGSITFDGSASDALSGLQSFTCTLDGAPLAVCNAISISSEGPHTLVMNASDNAGNTSLLSQSLSIDTQPPALSTSIQGTLGSNNWYNVAKLSASATDPSPGSGIFVIEYNIDNTGWIVFPTSGELDLPEGKHDLDIRALDYVGHSASSSKSFSLDNAVPTITVDPLGTLGLNNWYVTQLDLSADASDNISGVDIFEYALNGSPWTSYTTPLHLTDGSHSISFWAQDKAGLVRQVDQNYFVDTRPPQIAGTISGTPGTNGWYVSDVTLSAFAADPTPGSGMEAFSYNLDGAGQLPYTAALTLPDGTHTLQLIAQDKAGLTYSTEQTIQVDTVRPALNISTSLPAWNKGKLTWNGTSSDSGSGISKVEVSTNGGKTWQLTTGTASWSFEWDTVNHPNGIQTMLVRATDNAGLATEQALQVGIDNQSPKISMPASWLQWDSITLDIWDDESGLSTARIEISDPEGKHPNRVIDLSIDQFPLRFKWDRRFGDDKVAPYGKYDVSVTTVDKVGNSTQQTASIKVLLEILPAGPTSTPQPYSRIVSTSTPVYTSTPAPLPTSTSTAVVSAFGEIPPTAQSTPTPVATLEPRTAPTQTSVLDWLESIFTFSSASEGETTTVESFSSPTTDSTAPEAEVPVLWGSIAAAVVGVLSEHAAEWRRRQEEARAEKLKEEAEEDERREKRQEQKMEKLEQQWAQERAWEQARLQKEQEALDRRNDFMESKMDRIDAEDDAQWLASQIIIEKREEEKKKKEELKAGLEAYYSGRKQGEAEAAQPVQKNWWETFKSFLQESVLSPLNTYVYEPVIEPVVQAATEQITEAASWANNTIYQPYIQPVVETTVSFVSEEVSWINENIYQPYIQPAVETTVSFVSEEVSWINENIYQPYIQPTLVAINENVIEPYVAPVVSAVIEHVVDGATWVNENIYEPYLEPIVNYIDEVVYQPILAPVVNDVSGWWQDTWDEYGELVHGALDTAGFIPGLGEVADALNGLIYLGEGRYIEAGVSAMAMIPILGDLGKAGKWGIQLGAEVVEEVTEKVVKEVTEELVEKAIAETSEEIIEEVVEETAEEIVEQVTQEALEEATEKILKESVEDLSSKIVAETLENAAEKALKTELVENTVKEAADEVTTHAVKDATETIAATAAEQASQNIAETVVEKAVKHVDEAFISTITEKYGADQVEKFLPMCERYGIDPYDVLTRPPSEGQSLVGWVLGISDPNNPVNFALQEMDLPQSELDRILNDCVVRPESDVVVLGYGKGCSIPYYELSNKIEACNISLSATDWAPFDQARANFWTDINAPFIEKAVDERKVFLFNINYDVITDIDNVERFSLPELRLIEMAGNNYAPVPMGEYVAFFPTEMLESGADWPKELLKLGDLK